MEFRNENAFTFLPTIGSKTVDLVLIDPPYEVSRKTGFANGAPTGRDVDRFRVSMDFGSWDKEFTGLDVIIQECYRVLKDHGTMLCFYDLWKLETLQQYFKDAGFVQLRFLEWVKTNPVPINSKLNYLTNAREIAVSGCKKGKPVFNSVYDKGIYSYPICHDKGRFHPTQKPLELIKALVEKHSNEGDLVLDCFAGSCTTGVAALITKRDFIGCEISEEYFQKAEERIQQYVSTCDSNE